MTWVFILTLLAFQVTPELRQHVDSGLKAKAAGDLDTAAREFQRVVDLAPNLAAAHMNLGAVYFEKKDFAAAIPRLQKALELNPQLPGAHAMLGTALLSQGYAADAIAHLEKAQLNDLLGVALLEAGRPREAVDRLEGALASRPGDPDLLYYLSQAHGRLAKQAFDSLRQTRPDSPRVQEMMGEAMAASGNREAAEKHYRAALSARPDLHGIHYALGEIYLESADYDKAETEFRAETQLAPGSAAAAYKLGLVLLNRANVSGAIAELKRADSLRPDMPETLLELAKAIAASGENLDEARKLLERVLQMEQTSALAATAHFQLAQVYRKLGLPADAARETRLFQQLRRQAQESAPRSEPKN